MIYTLENEVLKLDVSDIGAETKSLIKKSTAENIFLTQIPNGGTTHRRFAFPCAEDFTTTNARLTVRIMTL